MASQASDSDLIKQINYTPTMTTALSALLKCNIQKPKICGLSLSKVPVHEIRSLKLNNRKRSQIESTHTNAIDLLSQMSIEVLCHILNFLPLRDVLKLECQNKQLQMVVRLNLKLHHIVDFSSGQVDV